MQPLLVLLDLSVMLTTIIWLQPCRLDLEPQPGILVEVMVSRRLKALEDQRRLDTMLRDGKSAMTVRFLIVSPLETIMLL